MSRYLSFTAILILLFNKEGFCQIDSVIIITQHAMVPIDAKPRGKTGTTYYPKKNCDYKAAIDEIYKIALKKKANLALITNSFHFFRDGKSCISLIAKLYAIQNSDLLRKKINSIPDTISGKNYSYLFLYRGKDAEYPGARTKTFQVLVDSSSTYTISQGCYYSIKISPGKHSLFIENSKENITLITEVGKSYYVRGNIDKNSSFVPGQIVFTVGGWYNSINLIEDEQAGKLEYDVVVAQKVEEKSRN